MIRVQMLPLLSILRLTLASLFIPVIELVFARYYLHSILGLHIGFYNTTDFDYFLPVPTAVLIFFCALQQQNRISLQWQPKWFIANINFFVGFILLNHLFLPIAHSFHSLYMVLWALLLALVCLSGFFIWIDPISFLKNPNRLMVFPCLLIALSIFLYRTFFPNLAEWLAPATSQLTHILFQIASANTSMQLSPGGFLRIDHPAFILRLGDGCVGGDAFFYFSCVFFIWFSLYSSQWSLIRWGITYILGLEVMFLLNSLRIFSLFNLGAIMSSVFGAETGRVLTMGLFHTHTGWVLYTIGIGIFIKVCSKIGSESLWEPLRPKPTSSY